MSEVTTTKFQSPVPILRKVRHLIFGKKGPDMFTRVTFYMNFIIWTTFMFWSVISYFALNSRQLILQQKGISVERIIQLRGQELGFQEGEFLNRLLTFHAISIICWLVVLFGLILLYRKIKRFFYFVIGGTVFHVGMMVFYIGFTYFIEDTTAYDKIPLLVIVVSSIIHYYLMNNERESGQFNFFGVDEDDSESEE